MQIKLNYKRTILVGFAFFLISAFWQAYDAIVPLILTNHFGLPQTASGAVMSIDNVLAVFMLPIFGAISDKVNTKYGKRTPFVFFGAIAAIIAFIALTLVDNYQIARIAAEGIPGVEATLGSDAAIKLALEYTMANPLPLIGFIATLLVVLVAMATFRSPAVALMPDVTPKPLRSKGNAIINLMGVVGAVIILASGILFGTGNPQKSLMSYVVYFAMVAVLMIVALVVFLFTVNEPKLVKKMKEESEEMGIVDEADDAESSDKKSEGKLSRGEFRSLIFILLSVIFWFMGYNAITSKYSVYAGAVLQLDYNTTLILAQAAALVAFIPVGMLATKIGRKKSILIGVGFLTSAVFVGSFFDAGVNIWLVNIVFIFAGLGWAMINVNSYPMVVELASRGNVGKYTGFYYTASMSAQTLTPILSGFFLDEYGIKTLFPYAAICVGISFVTMLFVKHGDSKPLAKKPSLEALDVD